jgi:hypothetical protein
MFMLSYTLFIGNIDLVSFKLSSLIERKIDLAIQMHNSYDLIQVIRA